MKIPSPAALIKSSALIVAIVGGMMFGTPRPAEAAPAMAPVEALAPAVGVTEIRYHRHWRRRHWHRHHWHRHHRRHYGFHRGRHYGHHYGRRHHFRGPRFRY